MTAILRLCAVVAQWTSVSVTGVDQKRIECSTHRLLVIGFPDSMPGEVMAAEALLSEGEAIGMLGEWVRKYR